MKIDYDRIARRMIEAWNMPTAFYHAADDAALFDFLILCDYGVTVTGPDPASFRLKRAGHDMIDSACRGVYTIDPLPVAIMRVPEIATKIAAYRKSEAARMTADRKRVATQAKERADRTPHNAQLDDL